MKSYKPKTSWSSILAIPLLGVALCTGPACSRHSPSALPVLSDPDVGLTVTLPPSATSFTRISAAKDRFLSTTPYDKKQTLLYLHTYSPPLVTTNAPPAFYEDIAESILRDELGSFLALETSFTNLPNQTSVLLIYGRARDPDKVVGFAFQCNNTHFIFIGLSGPDITPAQVTTFFQTTAPNLQLANIHQTTFAELSQYQQHLVGNPGPSEALNFIRNIFASRNSSPGNYTSAIHLAFLLAQELYRSNPNSPHLAETLALLNNMTSIRLADYLQARHDFEVAYGQENSREAIAQALFLSKLTFPFDAEGRALDKQRYRKAHSLP